MNLRYLVLIVLVALLVLVSAYAFLSLSNTGTVTSPVPTNFTVNGRTYTFNYTAINDAQRAAGLMNKKVTNSTTMLFDFPAPGTYRFWMYDTNTSLDMIWIDASGDMGRVVYIYAGAMPCYSQITCPTFGPSSPANFVIEAKAGFAKANGIEVGTEIQFG